MTKILCLTGAESSGKTTLARLLAETLDAPLVPEVAREMLIPGEPYDANDVVAIGRRQHAAEMAALRDAPQYLVCDTDLLVIRVWLEVRFGGWRAALDDCLAEQAPRHYLLTVPSMAWQADPLRENPTDRAALHGRYLAHLRNMAAPYIELHGTPEERLKKVLAEIVEAPED